MKNTLTNKRKSSFFIPMNGSVTPDQMDAIAAKMEEAARSLRVAAMALRGALEAPDAYPPAVLETAEKILRQSGKPLHIVDLFNRIRAAGAFVKDHYNLSSMLSKDRQKTFRPAYGQRGHWELVR